jgi:hypothetical protein
MLSIVTLKKGSVVVVKTVHPLPEEKADRLLTELKKVFPDNEVLLPNGAEIIIIEPE